MASRRLAPSLAVYCPRCNVPAGYKCLRYGVYSFGPSNGGSERLPIAHPERRKLAKKTRAATDALSDVPQEVQQAVGGYLCENISGCVPGPPARRPWKAKR